MFAGFFPLPGPCIPENRPPTPPLLQNRQTVVVVVSQFSGSSGSGYGMITIFPFATDSFTGTMDTSSSPLKVHDDK